MKKAKEKWLIKGRREKEEQQYHHLFLNEFNSSGNLLLLSLHKENSALVLVNYVLKSSTLVFIKLRSFTA